MIRYVELRRLLPTANILHAPYPTQAFFKHTTHTYLNKKNAQQKCFMTLRYINLLLTLTF